MELAVEALVQATTEGGAVPYHSANPGSMVIELCRQPRSVAEVAALMAVPLGVARVLIGDLIEAGYVDVRSTLSENATWDQRHELLERVLGGLRKL
ncbi:MAG TPA: DUF742 domain-containing protein [Pseudonocardiaceae bacterium]|nr:DUF742 domain-containing protein [Pseudonocardiaceae bacterium]